MFQRKPFLVLVPVLAAAGVGVTIWYFQQQQNSPNKELPGKDAVDAVGPQETNHDGKTIKQWIALLETGRPTGGSDRTTAAEKLVVIGEAAVPGLIGLLTHKHQDIRKLAVEGRETGTRLDDFSR